MSAAETPTLTQVLTLARRLPVADQLRLIARLAPELASVLPEHTAGDAWEELLQLGEETASLPPLAGDSAEVLSAMRR